jgi:exodeoxyribonuclease VII small subunit
MPKKAVPADFGKAFKELQGIADWFEGEQPDLDKGLEQFERAMELASFCREQLAAAEQKIEQIKKKSHESRVTSQE